jgi:pimeloyl-ACP methyl ester carboxylesterase
MIKFLLRYISWLIFILFISGCASVTKFPDLGELYNKSAQYHRIDRNPVILIPGFTGTKLVDNKTGQIVWGAFGGRSINPATPQGARLIALPLKEEGDSAPLNKDVIPKGVLEQVKVKLLGLPMYLHAYMNILKVLGAGNYYDEEFAKATGIYYGRGHYTCFQFDYDWRQDIANNAQRLHDFILAKRAYVQSEIKKEFGIKDYPVKFDLVAHSMGGLLARYYLQYGAVKLPENGSLPKMTWEGAQYVEKLVMVGTPNGGTMEAFLDLVHGVKFSVFLPKYEPAILGTMPSLYEMLPRTRHRPVVDAENPDASSLDLFDPELWIRMKWGLASDKQDQVLKRLLPSVADKQERYRIALDYLRKALKRAKQFTESMDKPFTPPSGVSFYLFAGDAQETNAVVGVDTKNGTLKVLKKEPGDGVVLRSSVLLDERSQKQWSPNLVSPISWGSVNFLFTDHLGLTKDRTFSDNLLFLLLEKDRKKF